MTLNIGIILLVIAAAFAIQVVFTVAAERRILPERWATSTVAYVFAIGSIASAASFTAVDFASTSPFGFFGYYFGASIIFLAGGAILFHLFALTQRYKLESLVDLLAFRFRAPWVGVTISIVIILTMLPLAAEQLSLLMTSINVATGELSNTPAPAEWLRSLPFALAVVLFTVVMGTYRQERKLRNNGIIVLFATVSALGLISVFAVMYLSLGHLHSSGINIAPSELTLADNNSSLWPKSALIISFSAVLCAPHIFHLTLGEQAKKSTFYKSFWGVPLLLLIFSLPLLPIAIAGTVLMPGHSPLLYLISLPLALGSSSVGLLVLTAKFFAYIAICALLCHISARIALNYLFIPLVKPHSHKNIHSWIRLAKLHSTGSFMFLTWILSNTFSLGENHRYAVDASCVLAQFLPATIALLYFPKVSSRGFIIGLIGGIASYFTLSYGDIYLWCNDCIADSLIYNAAPASLFINGLLMALGSSLFPRSSEDRLAASQTSLSSVESVSNSRLSQRSVNDFVTALVPLVGTKEARRQVARALNDLHLNASERRPYALVQVRDALQKNLADQLGASVIQNAVSQLLPYTLDDKQLASDDLGETNDSSNATYEGIAAELERLRRFHRQTLARLPVGVCYINANQEILLWNNSLEAMTGLSTTSTEGSSLTNLQDPWRTLIKNFLESDKAYINKANVEINGQQHWLALHKEKNNLDDRTQEIEDNVIVIEDITDIKTLEDELMHNERLASIGRLAAGVAHEIGNPVTGIACLAQNMKFDSDNPDVLDTAAEITRQTARIDSIVQTLVSFAHGGVNHTPTNTVPVAISECIRQAIKLIQLDRAAIQLKYDFMPDLSAKVLGDEPRLQQVFVNLLSNARDASPENSRVCIDVFQNLDSVVITITDQGTGIPKAIQEQVFDPFFTTKEPGKGTGLGLALVHSIIEEHKGSITITSPISANRGTRFEISLPATSG